MANSQAGLDQLRDRVSAALAGFLGRQRGVLGGIGDDMLPCLEAVTVLLAGGKRLRPAFCYWGWRAAGGADGDEIVTAAAALELLQASALVHDDVMDASEIRRGQPSMHRLFAARHAAAGGVGSADAFGTGAAILIGDLLLAWSDEMYHASGLSPAALQRGRPVLDAMHTEVMAGQYLDLLSQASGTDSLQSALRVITYKTAKYTIERPLHLGAALAGRQTRSRAAQIAAACTEYGLPLGVAFQLRDDLLGVFGDPAVTGKPVNGDLREGKRTVLVAIARERATAAQQRLLHRHLGDPQLTDAGAQAVRAVLTETGAVAECEVLISGSVKQALAALEAAPITGAASAALAELAVVATAREG